MGVLHRFFESGKEDRWSACKKMTQPVVRTPRTVQESIPIYRVAENGVFEIEKENGLDHLFDKAYYISDLNLAMQDEEEKTRLLLGYCKILNSLQIDAKIVIANHNRNLEDVRKNIYLQKETCTDTEAEIIRAYNETIEGKLMNKMSGLHQVKYLILTCRKKTFTEASAYFDQLESHLFLNMESIGSRLQALSGAQRMKTLHSIYRLGSETEFRENWEDLTTGSFRGNIAPMKIKPKLKKGIDYLQIDGKYLCTLSVKKNGWPTQLSDHFMRELSGLSFPSIVTIDLAPIPQDVAMKKMVKNLDNVEMKVQRQQEVRNKNKQWSSDITYEVRREKEIIEDTIDQLSNNGQKFFHAHLLICVYGDTEEELFSRIDTVCQTGEGSLLYFTPYCAQQLEAFHTSMPLGAREVNLLTRVLFTSSLAALNPFYVQELYQEGGLYYGVNYLSKKLLIGDRRTLMNGNGWVFGIPGSGKSFAVKMEIGQVYCGTEDDIIVIDPQHEYFPIADRLGGQIVNLSATTENYINPLDVPSGVENMGSFITEKSEFILELFRKIIGGMISATARSLIDKAVRMMYQVYFETAVQGSDAPTMHDLKRELEALKNPEANALALSLDMFTEGSLDLFAHQTNVKEQNRFMVYGIRELGAELRPIAMLVMIEAIRSRIAYNQSIGKVTWIYVDEAHELTQVDYTAKALERLWKEVRKQGGFMTGITQNITDILRNNTTKTMLANSEYVALLKQNDVDLSDLVGVINLSSRQLSHILSADKGVGLLKFGEKMIPFDHTVNKESKLYQMYNTNFHEKVEAGYFADVLEDGDVVHEVERQ